MFSASLEIEVRGSQELYDSPCGYPLIQIQCILSFWGWFAEDSIVAASSRSRGSDNGVSKETQAESRSRELLEALAFLDAGADQRINLGGRRNPDVRDLSKLLMYVK